MYQEDISEYLDELEWVREYYLALKPIDTKPQIVSSGTGSIVVNYDSNPFRGFVTYSAGLSPSDPDYYRYISPQTGHFTSV